MNVVLFGYGEMGCTGLEFLLSRSVPVLAVVTHHDNPQEKKWFRSLAELARSRGLDVRYGEDLGKAGLESLLREKRPTHLLSFYYRDMIPTSVLKLAETALNLHGSYLPRLRGRAPLNWALVECEERIGVTLHHMVKEPDAGDIVAQRGWNIAPTDTARTLFDRAVAETKLLLAEIWPKLADGTAPRTPQDPAKATYRGRRRPDDGKIDWSMPTKRIDGLVRAVTDPFPGAFTFLGGRKIMVWAGSPASGKGVPGAVLGPDLVATGDGAWRITKCEFADGGKPELRAGTKLGE